MPDLERNPIGIFCVPDLADLLTVADVGFCPVLSFTSTREALPAWRNELAYAPFPLVIADTGAGLETGMDAFLAEFAADLPIVVLRRPGDDGAIRAPGTARVLSTPVTANDIFDALGYERDERLEVLVSVPVGTSAPRTRLRRRDPMDAPAPATETTERDTFTEVDASEPGISTEPSSSPPSCFFDIPAPPAGTLSSRQSWARAAVSAAPRASVSTAEPEPARPLFEKALAGNDAAVVIVTSGKGGVSKTTTATSLASAAANAGLSALLLDANPEQGSVRTLLGIGGARSIPNISDLAHGASVRDVVLSPHVLNANRDKAGRVKPEQFYTVLAPVTQNVPDQQMLSRLYGQVLEETRGAFDLIIVDTGPLGRQFMHDPLITEVLLPLARDRAWVVAITDSSGMSREDLQFTLGTYHATGASGRLVPMMGLLDPAYEGVTPELVERYVHKTFAGIADHFAGITVRDHTLEALFNAHVINPEHAAIRPVIQAILRLVTGRDDLFPAPAAGRPEMGRAAQPAPKRRWIHRWKRRG